MRRHRIIALLRIGIISVFVAGCAVLRPLPGYVSTSARLAAIPVHNAPVKGRLVIHWNDNQIPFIEAEHDSDAAFGLGLVHAHLRLGQMEIFRRIGQGRIAEMGGLAAANLDHQLRTINFGRAVASIEESLPPETRSWLAAYVQGINYYQQNVRDLPIEFSVLDLKREPWTVADVLTFSRLAGNDVNWLVLLNALRLRNRKDWKQVWSRLVENGAASLPSFDNQDDLTGLNRLLVNVSKSGSNSLAVGPARSRTGAAIMASDPHLGITLPGLWLIAGLKSPSYHVVGLTAPGLPMFAIGRNPWIAWGGTNMRAASSDFYDISKLGPGDFSRRRERIAIRWWFDREITLRDTRWGPVLSDAPMFADENLPAFALRWTGHQPSDELGAMLRVSRSREFHEFRKAFRGFAVPGQNMLYADLDGNIGQVMAVQLPARNDALPDDVLVDPREGEAAWRRMVGVTDLPFSLNPDIGYLFSANNRPAPTTVPVGFFFSPDDRVVRINQIFENTARVGVDDVKRTQRDVYMPSSVELRDLYIQKLEPMIGKADAKRRAAIGLMRRWDGHYRAESRGAVAFELFHAAFSRAFYDEKFGAEDGIKFTGVGRIKSLLAEDIESVEPAALDRALEAGAVVLVDKLDEFENWGDMHRLKISHPLSFLPVIGGRYEFADLPAGGSSNTLMKTAHSTTDQRHNASYGATARHISDLSDLDRNYFALLGGQDGWINSDNFIDQIAGWQSGEYITVPLRIEKVRATFPHKTVLMPAAAGS